MPRVVSSTYRLQLNRAFGFREARSLVPYLHRLGVSHVYLSPILAASAGSQHGYDVIDHARLNPELGSDDDLRALAAELHDCSMGAILDIVPNHMAASAENPAWDNVLERGRGSRFASWFDIDWDAPRADGRLVLPVLGDELETVLQRREIVVDVRENGARVRYFDRSYPLDPATLPRELQLAQVDPAAAAEAERWGSGPGGAARLRDLLGQQRYRLCYWRRGLDEINYRRFFDVNDLVALRMETDEVFDATHALVLRLVRDGILDGLRVDHVDGLRDPAWYCVKLRRAVDEQRHEDAPEPFPIYVEKILSGDETLPRDWPVSGTTGYDFMGDVEELFLEPGGVERLEAHYRGLRRNPQLAFAAVALEGKRRALTGALWSDVRRIARLAHAWKPAADTDVVADAIVEVVARLACYRTYLVEPGVATEDDRRRLKEAFTGARRAGTADAKAIALLERAFLAPPDASDRPRAELVAKFQQLSGPAAAKGVEDTALYVYLPLASRNEVGAQPHRDPAVAIARAHERNAARARDWPRTLLATNTHDTKRSADLRSRLNVLTAMPDVWARYVNRWRRLNKPHKRVVGGKPAPDTNSEHLYYQTLLGLWPAPRPQRRVDDLPGREWLDRTRERLVAYMGKAAREAKTRTAWTERDPGFEKALDEFVRESFDASDDAPFLGDVARLAALTAREGQRFALARMLVHCLAPGVPDVYQGDELWNFTLVDPDNRRPVDFEQRVRLLARLDHAAAAALLHSAFVKGESELDDSVKLALLATLLRFRRHHPALVLAGDYVPIRTVASGARERIFGFARRNGSEVCMALARTRVQAAETDAGASEFASLPADFDGRWRSELTGRVIELVREGPGVFLMPSSQPCELLVPDNR